MKPTSLLFRILWLSPTFKCCVLAFAYGASHRTILKLIFRYA